MLDTKNGKLWQYVLLCDIKCFVTCSMINQVYKYMIRSLPLVTSPPIRMICQSRPISHFSNNCIFYSPLPPDIYGESLPFLQWINIVLQLFSLLHNLFLKCSAVVYLCIACWACLPVHGNKNINQNIFTLMYGRMFLNICKKPKTYLLLWTFIVSSFVTFVVCLFVCLYTQIK